jgi:hypothetical protein
MGSEPIEIEEMDEVIVGLMFNLLTQCFPVKKIKVRKRFKRGVDINGRIFFLPKDNYIVFGNLFSELGTLYGANNEEIKHVLTEFYSIKG